MIMLADKLKLPAIELAINAKGEKSVMKQLQDLAYSTALNSTLNNDKFPIHPDWKTNVEVLHHVPPDVRAVQVHDCTYGENPVTIWMEHHQIGLSQHELATPIG